MKITLGKCNIDLVLLFLFISPIFYFVDFTKMDVLNPDIPFQQYQLFIYAVSLITALTIKNKWVGGMIALSAVHCALQAKFDKFSCFQLIPILFAVVFYNTIAIHYKSTIKKIGSVFAIILAMNLAFSAIQFLKQDVYIQQTNLQMAGLMLLPCYLGQYAAITAPIIFSLNPWLVILPISSVLISKSSFCVIAMFCSFLFYFWNKSRKIFMGLLFFGLIGCVAFCFVDKKDGQWWRRIHIWKMVMSKAMRSPFIGHGLGSYNKTLWLEFQGGSGTKFYTLNIKEENKLVLEKILIEECQKNDTDWKRLNDIHFRQPGAPFSNLKDIFDEIRGQGKLSPYNWDQPHNEYIRIFYEFGMVGIAILIGFITLFFRAYMVNKNIALVASFIAILILALVHFPFYLPCLALTIIVILGILESKL